MKQRKKITSRIKAKVESKDERQAMDKTQKIQYSIEDESKEDGKDYRNKEDETDEGKCEE
jgi:hypothetical protein